MTDPHASEETLSQVAADHIASCAAQCRLTPAVHLSPYIVAEEGYCLAVRALEDKTRYNQIETTGGTFETIRAGDVLVGVLGERRALKGYSGHVARALKPGDELNVLNLGGILGRCTSDHPELGPALRTQVLGAVMVERGGQWRHARIQDGAIDPAATLSDSAPLVVVSGSSMHTGKTFAACRIIEGLTEKGLHVAATKLTGASLMRDLRRMQEHGARETASFVDAGVVSSIGKDMTPLAKGLIAHLNTAEPDVIVVELGDGFIGPYGVDALLHDKELQRFAKAHVVAATDLAGAWAADNLFRDTFRLPIAAMTGPVTDNAVGRKYIQNTLGIPALNACQNPAALAGCVARSLEAPASTNGVSTSALEAVHL